MLSSVNKILLFVCQVHHGNRLRNSLEIILLSSSGKLFLDGIETPAVTHKEKTILKKFNYKLMYFVPAGEGEF